MAQGNVTQVNAGIASKISAVKIAYADIRRLMDRLIVIRNGTDYTAVEAATGAVVGDGQKVFDNLDAALAGLTTANDALSNMDVSVL